MNFYTAWAIKNVGVVLVTALAVWITKSPWALLGLIFLSTAKSNPNEKTGQENE